MTTFGSHFVKEVSRAQLSSAAKVLLPVHMKKKLVGAEKAAFITSLALPFLDHNIVLVYKSAMLSNLSRGDV